MTVIETRIRWADNTRDLATNLKEGLNQVEAMRTSVDRLATRLGGDGLLRAANTLTAAIHELGGATKLTKDEQERASATLDKALAKYQALGREAPAAMRQLADQIRPVAPALEPIPTKLQAITASAVTMAGALGIVFGPLAIISGMVRFATAALDDADALEKMHDKTGIGVEALQRLRVVADEAGNTLEDITGAVNKFQRQLETGKADEALGRLGLSVAYIKSLSPDEQFLAIGEAISKVEDPAKRVTLAMELFGKGGAEILPSLLHAANDLKDGVNVMSAEAVKGLDALGDAFTAMWRNVKTGVGQFLGERTAELIGGINRWKLILAQVGVGGATPTLPNAPKVATNAPGETKTLDEADIKTITRVLDDQQHQLEKNAESAKKLAEAHKKLIESIRVLDGDTRAEGIAFDLANVGMKVAIPTIDTLADRVERLQRGGQFMAAFWEKAGITMGKLPNVVPAGTAAIKDALTVTEKWADVFDKFPDLLTAAFTGGGGLAGAMKGFSNEITKSLFGKDGPLKSMTTGLSDAVTDLTKGLGGTVSKLLGNTIGSLLPGLGGMVSGLIGPLMKLIGGIGGPSQAEKDARTAQDQLVTSLRTTATQAQQAEGAFKDTYHTIAIVARDAYMKLGQSADEADVHVKALLNTHDPQAFMAAMQDLNAVLSEQGQETADLDAAIKRYGFSIAELGPTMQKQQLDAQAKEILNDWRLLVESGIEMSTVNTRMAGTMQDYLDTARKTGQEVPASMRPILESMVQQGLLTDANGAAITDMTQLGVTFSETMTAGFDKVVKKLDELIKRLTGGLPDALAALSDIETDVTLNAHWNLDSLPAPDGASFGADGGLVTSRGVQYLAGGGRVGRLLSFRPRGIDTVPIMAAPGEGMVTRRGMGVLGLDGLAALNRGERAGQVVDLSAVREEIAALRATNDRLARYLQYDQPRALAKAAVAAAQTSTRSRK